MTRSVVFNLIILLMIHSASQSTSDKVFSILLLAFYWTSRVDQLLQLYRPLCSNLTWYLSGERLQEGKIHAQHLGFLITTQPCPNRGQQISP